MATGYRTIALTVSTAVFMQYLDATALNTALPAIGRDLHVQAIDLNVAILAYQLSLAAFIPLGSLAAERLGGRNAFAMSLFVFMCGSLLCALSSSLPALVAARAFQGVGGAVMMPVSRLLVVRSAAKNELVSAMNWLLIPGIVGPLLGPAVGGLIVTYASWHWIFLINVPVALIGIAMTFAIVPDVRDQGSGPFDLTGVLLVAPAIFGLVFGLDSLAKATPVWITAMLLAGSLLLIAFYLRHARLVSSPVVDLSLLSIDSFRHSMASGTMLRAVASASGFLLPLWFQLAMHMSAAQAGTLMVMSSLGALMTRFIAGPLLRLSHPRAVAIYGVAALAVMLLVTALLSQSWPPPFIYLLMLVQGLAMAIPMLVIGAVAYVDIPAERTAAATGFYTTVQQLTLSLGVTLAVWTASAIGWLGDATPGDNRTYSGSFIVLGGFTVLALFVTRKLDVESTGALRAQKRAA